MKLKSDWLKELLKSTGGASDGGGESAVEDEGAQKQPATDHGAQVLKSSSLSTEQRDGVRPASAGNKQCCTWQKEQSSGRIVSDGLPERKTTHASLRPCVLVAKVRESMSAPLGHTNVYGCLSVCHQPTSCIILP